MLLVFCFQTRFLLYFALLQQRDFLGIFLSIRVFAHCLQVICQSIAHGRFLLNFYDSFSSFSLPFNFSVSFSEHGWQRAGSSCLVCARRCFPVIHCFLLTPSFVPPQCGGKTDCIACPLQHLSQGGVMAEVSPSTLPAWSQLNFLLRCTVSAWGQFIRQSRSRRMLGEAGNSDDRQSLCHLPQLLATDVLFISKSAMKTLTSIRNMFNDKFSSFEIWWLKDEEPQACHECTQGCL